MFLALELEGGRKGSDGDLMGMFTRTEVTRKKNGMAEEKTKSMHFYLISNQITFLFVLEETLIIIK